VAGKRMFKAEKKSRGLGREVDVFKEQTGSQLT
jgi:hypothetical protein